MKGRRPKHAAPLAAPSDAWSTPVALLAIAIAGLIAYANSFAGVFLFDDLGSIVRNAHIRSLTPLSQVLLPPADTPLAGRPLVQLSLAINYAMGSTSVWGYHVVNLALHLTCGGLIYLLIRRAGTQTIAFAVALLWTVHPLNSEVVNYLTQRTESMMAVCFLFTLYAASRNWRTAAITICAAGMLCKETMAVAPIAVVLYDYAFSGSASFADTVTRRWTLYAALAATWIVPAVMLATRGQTLNGGFASAHVGAWTYLLNQPTMILRYFRLAIWPRDLVLYYGWPRALTLADVWLPAIVVIALVITSIVVAVTRWRRIGALAVWVFLLLAPTSSILPIATEVGAERRMYLPLIGLIALAVAGLTWLGRQRPALRAVPATVVAIVVVALGATTFARNAEYASSLGMAHTILARWPTPNAHYLVGTELLVAGRHADAVSHLRVAAEQYPPARYSLGEALFGSGQPAAAIVEFERFQREEPTLSPINTRFQIAKAYGSMGQMPQAIENLTAVIAAAPNLIEARGLMAEALADQHRYAEAIPHYGAYLESNQRNAAVWTRLAGALMAVSRQADAIEALKRATAADPAYAPAQAALRALAAK